MIFCGLFVVNRIQMGRGAHSIDGVRNLIQNLKNDGKTLSQIAKIVGCSKTKVHFAINFKRKSKKRGRKRATTTKFDQLLVRKSNTNPFLLSEKLKLE